MNLVLAWPPAALNPNARVHYQEHAKARKAYRTDCAWQAKSQGARQIAADALKLRIVFVPPDRRHRDLDNMLASIKSGLDGIADVLGVNDRCWTLEISRADEVGGFVRVEVVA